jgi:hypothetical protein
MSFTAAVMPSLLIPEEPVLWATMVFSGSCPLNRFFPCFGFPHHFPDKPVAFL